MNEMNRREFGWAGLGSLMAAWPWLRGGAPALAEAAGPPNIIFLLADDLRWDALGCTGLVQGHTPHLDALARDGVLFERAYVTTSICAASRATILSGQYTCRHGLDDFQKTFSSEAFAKVYPVLLRQAGYATGFVGKYGVGEQMPEDQFDYWRGFAGQGHYELQDEQGRFKHLTQAQEEDARNFLRQYGGRQPFCLSVSFKAPHCQDGDPRQFIYDPRDEDVFKDAVFPEPATGGDAFYNQFPEFFRNNNEARRRWEIRFSTPDLYQRMVRAYYRLIAGIDRAVGGMCAELDQLGIAGNTVIVFTSDNGFYLGEHGLAGKWFGHEPSIRVPLIVHDPRLPASLRGRRRRALALNVDMAPTLAALAGLTPPAEMQGRSLLPLLGEETVAWREDFFYEHVFAHPGIPKSEGVAGGRYKYLRYYEATPVYEELFDLETDPEETRNLALMPEQGALLKRMRTRCAELKSVWCA